MSVRFVTQEVVDSTNRVAADLFFSSASREPVFVFAREQTAGRGRHGRLWVSPRGGAWCSLAWGVSEDDRHSAASLVAGLAARDAVVRACESLGLSRTRVAIKWPNDLLLDCDPRQPGRDLRKFAGVLCERPQPGVLIIGIGVNVDFDAEEIPDSLGDAPRTPVTTLRSAFQRNVEPETVARALAETLPQSLVALERDGFSVFAPELRAALAHLGEPVTWETPSGRVFGRIAGVDDDGRLLLDVGAAEFAALSSGEVSRLPEADWPGKG